MKNKPAYIIAACICFASSVLFAGALELSEIMFSPEEGGEWIEFFTHNESIDMNGTSIADNYQEDRIMCCPGNTGCNTTVPGYTYFLISDPQSGMINNSGIVFCTDDTKIGNGLGNQDDAIRLAKNNETIYFMEYNLTVAKGHTLSLVNSTYLESLPTPQLPNLLYVPEDKGNNSQQENVNLSGQANDSVDVGIEIITGGSLITFTKYDSFFKIRNLDYQRSGEELHVILYYNVTYVPDQGIFSESSSDLSFLSYKSSRTSNITFTIKGEYLICAIAYLENDSFRENNAACAYVNVSDAYSVPCNMALSSSSDKEIYGPGEKIILSHWLSNEDFPYEIEYWAETLFGEIEFQKTLTGNTNTKHMALDADETDKAYLIFSRLITMCNNSAAENLSQILVVIKGEKSQDGNKSNISIISVSDEAPDFGDTIEVRLNVHKGETRKTSVKIYVQGDGKKISEEVSMNLENKNADYEFALPLRIKENCDRKYETGKYIVVSEGLDTSSEKEIILGDNKGCPEKAATESSSKTKPKARASEEEKSPAAAPGRLYMLERADLENSTLSFSIALNNPDSTTHNYSLSFSIYSGRNLMLKGNLTETTLERQSEKIKSGEISLGSLHDGNYTLKLKILRDDRKTPYELSEGFIIKGTTDLPGPDKKTMQEQENKTEPLGPVQGITAGAGAETNSTAGQGTVTGKIIYSSKNSVLKDKSIYFVLLVLVIFSIVILLKKNN